MAHFCTKCGATYAEGACFCDACGNPLNKPAAIAIAPATSPLTASGVTPPPKVNSRMLVLAGCAVAVLAVAGGGIAWWMAPETASVASFSRAINDYFANNAKAQERLLCLSNIPYQRDQIRVAPFDQSTKQWMDTLARSGVYSGSEERSGSGYFAQTHYVYQLTPMGKTSVRNDKLCLASGLKVKAVTGFDRVQDTNGRSTALASSVLDMTDEASWLSKSPDRTKILQSMHAQTISANFPLVIIDKKWQVDEINLLSGNGSFSKNASNQSSSTATRPHTSGFLDKLKSLFSFGSSHPLVGKWNGPLGANFEFTEDSFITNGVAVKARFTTKGDEVTVSPEAMNGVGIVYKMVGKNTAAMGMGPMSFELKRVKTDGTNPGLGNVGDDEPSEAQLKEALQKSPSSASLSGAMREVTYFKKDTCSMGSSEKSYMCTFEYRFDNYEIKTSSKTFSRNEEGWVMYGI